MDRLAPFEGASASRTFPSMLHPRDVDNDDDQEHKLSNMSVLDKVACIDQGQRGFFDTQFTGNIADFDLKLCLPTGQIGYGNLNNRQFERQLPYQQPVMDSRLAHVRKLNPVLYDVVPDSVMMNAESVATQGYELEALQFWKEKRPYLFEQMTQENCLKLLITAQILNQARLLAMLGKTKCLYDLIPTGANTWIAKLKNKPTDEMSLILPYTVGELALLKYKAFSLEFVVQEVTDEQLLLKLDNNQPQIPTEMLNRPIVTFLTFKQRDDLLCRLSMTATIDALTAMKDVFLPEVAPKRSGVPLVSHNQLERLQNNTGFQNTQLDRCQQEAALRVLTHKCTRTVYTLISPPGTGKSMVMDEIVWQIVFHHRGDIRQDSVVHVAMPSTEGCRAMAQRLVDKGVPAQMMKLLILDQELERNEGTYWTERVSQLKFDPKVQIYFGKPEALGRIFLCTDKQFFRPPLIVLLDNVCTMPVGEAFIPCVSNGEPESIVMAGDIMQVKPKCHSKVSEMLAGRTTIVDVLMLSEFLFLNKPGCYPLPNPFTGSRFQVVYRAHQDVVKVLSDLYYGGNLECSVNSSISLDSKIMMRKLASLGFFAKIEKQFIWIDPTAKLRGQENQDEVYLTRFANKLAQAVDGKNIMVLSKYKKQAALLQTLIPQSSGVVNGYYEDLCLPLEKPIVIIPTVNGSEENMDRHLGKDFLAWNAMLSRAQMLVIIFGSVEKIENSDTHYIKYLIREADHFDL